MKRHWSTVAGLPVVGPEGEKFLGRLKAVFVHPENGQILAFLVGWMHVVIPRDVSHWGAEEVRLHDEDDLVRPEEILRLKEFGLSRTLLNGKKVLTLSGHRLGTLKDFSFDTTTDSLATLDVSKSFLFWEWAERQFSAKDIREITDRAIVLNVDLAQKEKVTDSATLSIAT